jgi:glutamate-5-semialdehyde dehydrogenase
MEDIRAHVEEVARSAAGAAQSLRALAPEALDDILRDIAARLEHHASEVLEANEGDVEAGRETLSGAVLDRLKLDRDRLSGICEQVRTLAELPAVDEVVERHERAGSAIEVRRVPVGVIGANYEARANVTVDIASQLIKSRNGGVLRTGGAALRTASAVIDLAVAPALESHGAAADAVGLVRTPAHEAASALVSLPRLVPLVILRGSGETTSRLVREAAAHGVRTLAHAEGGGVLFVHASADGERAITLIERSLDRLGVCNRLNLLLIDTAIWEEFSSRAVELLGRLGIESSLPPHAHPLGYEWALDPDRAATVTMAPAESAAAAARIANEETSGLAAAIAAEDDAAAREFIAAYQGTGVFWNQTTRLLDGFKLFAAPETGISIDKVPGPRGPVTYRDLHLRQVVAVPAAVPGAFEIEA